MFSNKLFSVLFSDWWHILQRERILQYETEMNNYHHQQLNSILQWCLIDEVDDDDDDSHDADNIFYYTK